MTLRAEVTEGILVFRFEGATPARDIYAIIHREFAAAPRDAQPLMDLRGSTSLADRTPELVKMLTEFAVEHPERPGSAVAVVLPTTELERWTRLAKEITTETGVPIEVFTDDTPARTWLDAARGSGEAHG